MVSGWIQSNLKAHQGNALLAVSVMHESRSHHYHFGGNGLGNMPSRVHSGSKVPSDVLPRRCFYKLLCCSLGSELFPFPSREGNAAGSSCAQKRKTQHKRNRNHREQSKGSLISYGLVDLRLERTLTLPVLICYLS